MGSLTPREGRFNGRTHSQNMQLQIAAATWRIQRSDSAFCQITLVLVVVAIVVVIISGIMAWGQLSLPYILACQKIFLLSEIFSHK